MSAYIDAVTYHLPAILPHPVSYTADRLGDGLTREPLGEATLTTSGLATEAARKLFDEHTVDADDVDFVVLVTQTPDFALPTTACIVQGRLALRNDAGALDITSGSNGYLYGLAISRGLIESGQVQTVLVLTADTNAVFGGIAAENPGRVVGGGATATLVRSDPRGERSLSGFTLGTVDSHDDASEPESKTGVAMISQIISEVLTKSETAIQDVDILVGYLPAAIQINELASHLCIPSKRLKGVPPMARVLASSSLPIALADLARAGGINRSSTVLLVDYHVEGSWGGVLAKW